MRRIRTKTIAKGREVTRQLRCQMIWPNICARVARRVALYARVSTEDRGQDPELQLVPMREHAAARGWEVIEYVDQASAGDLRGRRGWRQLLEDAHC